ncbi:MAG: hypothetical protein K2P70_04985 [Hyphomonadaceae bacterium]|nr:hypothetical protein [Hyphomonadaceae bacterium]
MSIAQQEFLKICGGCGEIYDANIEAEALHHVTAEHQPLLPPRKRTSRPVSCERAAAETERSGEVIALGTRRYSSNVLSPMITRNSIP